MLKANILVIEDDPISQTLLAEILKTAGYTFFLADTVVKAWSVFTAPEQQFDAVLLDRHLPDMDGLAFLERQQAEPAVAQIPVILQTSLSRAEDIQQGLRAGAYYYLTKPFHNQTLLAILVAAVKDYRHYRQIQAQARLAEGKLAQLAHLKSAEFCFRTPKQARDIAALLANACPEAEKVAIGLAELLLNAVEHGNLGISYAEKSQLLTEKRWQEEIEARLAKPEYAAKTASVQFKRNAADIHFHICDEGAGFDWRDFLEMRVERAFDLHGRGIAMAKLLSFDQLEYLGKGNEVLAVVSLCSKAGETAPIS